MSASPPDGPRRIYFEDSTPDNSTGTESGKKIRRGVSGKSKPTIPPPPWLNHGDSEVQIAQPSANAAVVVDIGELQSRIDKNLTSLKTDVTVLATRLASLLSTFASSRTRSLTQSAIELDSDRKRIETIRREQTDSAEQRHNLQSRTAVEDLSRVIESLAPGIAGAEWGEKDWHPVFEASSVSDHYRVGRIDNDELKHAAIVPLAPGAGWHLHGRTRPGQELVLATILRILVSAPLSNLHIHAFDPRMSATLGPLAPIRNINPASFSLPTTQADDFAQHLDAIVDGASLNAERVVSGGAHSLTELWRNQDSPEGILNVVAVFDYPYGIDESLQNALIKLAKLGPAAGIILLVQSSGEAPESDRIVPVDLTNELLDLQIEGETIRVAGFPEGIPIIADRAPGVSEIDNLVREVKEKFERGNAVTLLLEDLIQDDLSEPWRHSANNSLEATIGRAGRDVLNLVLGTSNPPNAFALIGGATGTGKSNLLMAIIYSLAVKYGPDQLSMYLLDFKQGLEFKQFGANNDGTGWLPHAKVLSLESDQQFGIAVLERINAELESRAELFKAAGGFKSYDQYVENSGNTLERLLIVIDEFHVLFEEQSDETEYAVSLLETIVRQARAFGVHLILASQTVSGIAGLARKGDSIFSQIAVRISLKNNIAESRAILSNENTAPTTLTGRGEVIINRDFGMNPEGSNQRGFVAYVNSKAFTKVQEKLWERSRSEPPVIFYGREFASWNLDDLQRLESSNDHLDLWIGRPISTEREPIYLRSRTEADQGIAILGPDRDQQPALPGLITGIVASATPQLGDEGEIVILNGFGESTPEWLYPVLELADSKGLKVRVIPARSAAEVLRGEIHDRISSRTGQMLLISLATQRIPDLALEVQSDPMHAQAHDTAEEESLIRMNFSNPDSQGAADDPIRSGRKTLSLIAREGGLSGIRMIGTWNNLGALQADMGYNYGGIQALITVGLGTEDLKAASGGYKARIEGWPRIGIIDRNSSSSLKSIVPFQVWQRDFTDRLIRIP
ncbi:MAG: hypothetical protein KF742_02485 [Cryobacterium sp.]|nr:hypothetical protein [Cryobacterium sp.]